MIPNTELFKELHEPPNLAPRIVDIGTVWADMPDDQPPFVAMLVKLRYPELQFHEQMMMLKLEVGLLRDLLDQLIEHEARVNEKGSGT